MEKHPISLQRVTYTLIIVFLIGYLLIIGRNFLMPIVFAGLFAFLLKPICERLEKFIPWRGVAIFATFLLVLLPILGLFILLSSQIVNIIQDFSALGEKLDAGIFEFKGWLQQQFGFTRAESEKLITEQAPKLLEGPLSQLGESMSSTSFYLISIVLSGIYTFFFLFYRTAFKNFVIIQVHKDKRQEFQNLISKIQKIIQKYLLGLSLVVLILGGLNSLALWLIGIKHALFWGYTAGILAIIPYVGTFVGALLPFIFALATTNNYLQPVLVVVAFNIIQLVETNFITPKVAGSSVKINPLAAILALIFGGFVWGIPGLILALPTMAIFKVISKQIEYLRPLSFLLSSEIYDKEGLILDQYDGQRYRLINFFRKPKR